MAQEQKFIDITPTWSALMPWMLCVLEDPRTKEEGKKPLREELYRLAKIADEMKANLNEV